MKNKIMKLDNLFTFYEDVRQIVGYYDENVFLEDYEIKDLQRVADARYQELEDAFIEEKYEIMKKWVFGATEEELEEHYEYYKVEKGDKEDLLNTMFESYCDSYDYIELDKAIESFKEV